MPVADSSGMSYNGAKSRTWAVYPSLPKANTWKLTASYLRVIAVIASMSGFKDYSIATSRSGIIMSGKPE